MEQSTYNLIVKLCDNTEYKELNGHSLQTLYKYRKKVKNEEYRLMLKDNERVLQKLVEVPKQFSQKNFEIQVLKEPENASEPEEGTHYKIIKNKKVFCDIIPEHQVEAVLKTSHIQSGHGGRDKMLFQLYSNNVYFYSMYVT